MARCDPKADVDVELLARSSLSLLAREMEEDGVGSVKAATQPAIGEELSPETVSPFGASIKFEEEGARSLAPCEPPESIRAHLCGEVGRTTLLAPPPIKLEAGLCPAASGQLKSIAEKSGMTAETLRTWVRQAERDGGRRTGLSTQERDRLRNLEKENKELRRANEILKAASSFFARELDPRLPR
jgi:transposase